MAEILFNNFFLRMDSSMKRKDIPQQNHKNQPKRKNKWKEIWIRAKPGKEKKGKEELSRR